MDTVRRLHRNAENMAVQENLPLGLFDETPIVKVRHKGEWYFGVNSFIEVLTSTRDVKTYLRDMKSREPELNLKWGEIILPVDMITKDGKRRSVNTTNTQGALRLLQSIPSPKAEPFKARLASLGRERVEEFNDPELGIQRARERAVEAYSRKGWSSQEIKKRLQGIDIRHGFTDELKERGIQGKAYAIITNKAYEWSGKTASEYKELKGLAKNDNLRDNMTTMEMLLTSVSEEAGKEIIQAKDSREYREIEEAVGAGARIARKAKENLEEQTGMSVVSDFNRLSGKQRALRGKRGLRQISAQKKDYL